MKKFGSNKIPSKDDMEFYKLTSDLRSHFHDALWEEEKHYTWLISILLGVIVLVTVRLNVGTEELKLLIVFGLSYIGGIFSKIAFNVIKEESQYFQIAFYRHVKAENKIFPSNPCPVPSSSWEPDNCWRLLWLLVFTNKRLGVRGNFLATFVLFDKVFLILASASFWFYFGASIKRILN